MQFERREEVKVEGEVTICIGVSGMETTSDISLFFIHGMGSSSATWHNQVSQLSPHCQVICPDLRGHGASGDCDSLDIHLLVDDVSKVLFSLQDSVIGARKVVLIGHSVGGVIATFVAHAFAALNINLICAVVCLDMVEGTATRAIPTMKASIESWPKEFPSVASCIDWSVRHHHPTKISSAEKSIPAILRRTSPDGPYVMRPRLDAYENDWQGWFLNFNKSFLGLNSINVPHLLLLSSPDRLDKELTIAQMQGKFQLKFIQGGFGEHFLHEDQAEQTLIILLNFLKSIGLVSQQFINMIISNALSTSLPPSIQSHQHC